MIPYHEFLLRFWGKTPKFATDPPENYHPAMFHMLDVAFVAEALVSHPASTRFRQTIASAWSGVSHDHFVAWLPFIIATHDLGKISAAFQGQAKDGRSQQQRDRLERSGISFPPSYERAPYHAEVSAVWLHQHLIRREPGTSTRLMWAIRDAMGGHHGRFTQEHIRDIAKRLRASERNAPQWDTWRDESYTLLRHLLSPPGDLASLGEPHHLRPATAVLTGFIILCDWIGSNSDYFPAAPTLPIEAYMQTGRRRATEALARAGLVPERPAPTYATFEQLPFAISSPRPLQRAIDDVPAEACVGPLLAVMEAPTGEGKTESALALARRLSAHGGVDELFFALPTMATSNQMYGRLSHFYHDLYGAAVRLTHSQAPVLEDDLHRAALAGDQDALAPQALSARAALEWFTGPKKAMLAPFGVGTVDQVELAGLNVRHYMLRLFALAGKVVIIDEVHAYDAYMSVILEHTLTWLASLGTSVILLSATLPATRHRKLAASYLRGLDRHLPAPDVPVDLPYPAISLYNTGEPYRATPGVFRPDQRLTLRLSSQMEPEQDAQYLLDLVRDGGAVARICNRVDDAQKIYQALQKICPHDQRVLLHARFPLKERTNRERIIDERVGKQSTRTSDHPSIIIGTQVLEQSLDYDVDVMVSDFAPIDLLLQRAGRLHRHIQERAGKRPVRHSQPLLEVMLPLDQDELPNWKRWAAIYDAYILWRTWEVLRQEMPANEREIVLPRDYRTLIEAVYQDHPQVQATTAYTDQMTKALQKLEHTWGEMRSQARMQLTPSAESTDAITEVADIAFVEDELGKLAGWQVAKTRLGDRITIVPLYRVNGDLCFDAGGTHRLSSDIPPRTADELKDIFEHSIPISDRRIIAELRDSDHRDRRWPWGDVPLMLRSMVPVVLDMNHQAAIGEQIIYLDTECGLVIE
jgi:CRISPR-associated endonuclease/helicase Cas3